MLKWLVAAMGALLVVAGGYTAAQGWDIVQVERGWSQVIAGSGLLTGGFIILAIAALMARVDAVVRSIANAQGVARVNRSDFAAPGPVAPPLDDSPQASEESNTPPVAAAVDVPLPAAQLPEPAAGPEPTTRPVLDLELEPAGLAQSGAEKIDLEKIRKPERPIPPIPRLPPKIPRPFLKPRIAELPKEPDPEPMPAQGQGVPARQTDLRAGIWPDDIEELAPATHVQEPEPEPAEQPPAATLVRRYESGGVSYQLFSNGSIEAQTEGGFYKFSSLDELRAFIESKKD